MLLYTDNMHNFPRQLVVKWCVLCSFVRCGTSKQIETKQNKNTKKTKNVPYSHQNSLPLYFAPFNFRPPWVKLSTINFRPLYRSLIFCPSDRSKRKFQGTYEIQNGYPKVINFCGINSAQFFKFFKFRWPFTPFNFRSPIFGAQFAPFNFRPSPNFGAQFAPFNFSPPGGRKLRGGEIWWE